MKKPFIILLVISNYALAQDAKIVLPEEMAKANYFNALQDLEAMLQNPEEINFKKAVFTVENAYMNNRLDYDYFNKQIFFLVNIANQIIESRELIYDYSDKEKVEKFGAIYLTLMDTTKILVEDTVFLHSPFSYDFEDFAGEKDWTKMFVTKLLETGTGNCHSLPFLYKILAEEMGEIAYLSMAPNHTYIKLKTEKNGWFNTELTSGTFPIDAWIMASGYIHLNAVQNGIYMDTLSSVQSIAVTIADLATGYNKRFGESDNPEFILDCIDIALTHYPDYINALLLKAETMKIIFERMMKEYAVESPSELFEYTEPKVWFDTMEKLYFKIHQLGYRKMPKQMYLNWLADLNENKDKYVNKEIFRNLKTENNE